MKLTDKIEVLNEDCMEVMAKYPDKYFDLAVCDVNYGIGEDGLKNHSRNNLAKATKYTDKSWDKDSVEKIVLDEIRRVSKNQIIFGANHFISKMAIDSSCWIIWDKDNSGDFADAEIAWTSFRTAIRIFKYRWNGMLQQNMKNKEVRIHPTQKPVALYDWIFKNYASCSECKNDGYILTSDARETYCPKCNGIPTKILDTHGGSMSSVISADKAGLFMTCCELDKEYFDKAVDRFKKYKSQNVLEFK